MPYPTIARYAESVSQPFGLFRTLGEPSCQRDAYGSPAIYAGGNAAVFRISAAGRDYALKCFIRPVARAREVCDYVSGSNSPLFCRTEYLPGEIFVYDMDDSGRWHDVVITEWAEGRTLDFCIRKALHDADAVKLDALAAEFGRMALEMLGCPWAHGDLKPENIIVASDDSMRLIDYDALFFPGLDRQPSDQLGTPLWQHPRRDEYFFNRHSDDYPSAMISATLHALAADPSLHGRFGDCDTFLFHPEEIACGKSAGYGHAKELAARRCNAPLYRLLEALSSPTPQIVGLAEILGALNDTVGDKPESGSLTAFNRGPLWGYEDGEGREAIAPLFDSALEFSEGLAAVTLGDCNHFIDERGRCAINCAEYEKVKPFCEGRAAVCRDGLWGYIDKTGHITVEPQYPNAKLAAMRNS